MFLPNVPGARSIPEFRVSKYYKHSIYESEKGLSIYKTLRNKISLLENVFFLFVNPLFSINGTNVQSFTQPYSKSTLHSILSRKLLLCDRNNF